jgi:hypothetical protein
VQRAPSELRTSVHFQSDVMQSQVQSRLQCLTSAEGHIRKLGDQNYMQRPGTPGVRATPRRHPTPYP